MSEAGATRRDFAVEVETEPLPNFTTPIGVAVDWISRELASHRHVLQVSAAGTGERCVVVQATVSAASAMEAVASVVEGMQSVGRKRDFGVIAVRSVSSGPARANDWAGSRRVPVSTTASASVDLPPALDLGRLISSVATLSQELTNCGHPEMSRGLAPYLRAGSHNPELIKGLRHQLAQIRSTEVSVLYNLERRLDELIALATEALARFRTREQH